MEQRSQWNFVMGEGGWVWSVTHPDGRKERSDETFKTLKQCADDATQRGYVAWKAADERRRDPIPGAATVLSRDATGK